MKRSSRNTLCALTFSLLAGDLCAQERPNIVVFLVDDMGLMDTSVPFAVDKDGCPVAQPLNRWYRTPNMERLAAQGTRFSTFYAQSVSSPSRASLLTGQNAARHRTTNWIAPYRNNRDAFGPPQWNWEGLTADDFTYPRLLKQAGYRTIHVGKAHFGHDRSEGKDPTRLGFDVNVAGCAIGHPGSYRGENGYGWLKGQRSNAVPDLEAYHGTPTFLTDALTIEAGREIEKAVAEGKPFYLNLAHYAVHAPFETDKRFARNYDGSSKSGQAKAFATLVEGMDKSLGDLLAKLEALGVAENTLVVFLGDNGGDAPLGGAADYGSSAPFKGKKGSEYEGGMRVPFIVSWAKRDDGNALQKAFPVLPGRVETRPGTIMDVFPTVLSAAGVKLPAGHVLDGSDLKGLLAGKKGRGRRDDFLMHFPHAHRGSYFTVFRKGDWKLIYYYHPESGGVPSCKLFNLKDDPYEKEDVAKLNPKTVKRLCRLMAERLEEEDALYPVDKRGRTLHPVVPE